MTLSVTVGPQNVNPFVKFDNFVSMFRQDRTNICSCCAVVYTFQVWWSVTSDVLRWAPSFWRRSLWHWHLSCVWRRVVWHVYTDVGAYSFRLKKVSFYYEAVSVSSSETSEIVYQTSRCHKFSAVLVPVFGNW